jgi:hypothetical protein
LKVAGIAGGIEAIIMQKWEYTVVLIDLWGGMSKINFIPLIV